MENANIRPLHVIAREIRDDWAKIGKGVSAYARPYLDAMGEMNKISDPYYEDSGESVVLYFLANAGSYRGDAAKRLKAELKALLGDK